MAEKAVYGSWKSPIDLDLVCGSVIALEQVVVDQSNGTIYHLEKQPPSGRSCLISSADGFELTPKESSTRTRVHEYGGAPVAIHKNRAILSDFASNTVFQRVKDSNGHFSEAQGVVPKNEAFRYADFAIHPSKPTLVAAIKEDHTIDEPSKVINTLVIIDTETTNITTIASGRSFYSHPRFNIKGDKILWFEWDLPHMPWESSQLCLASFVTNEAIKVEKKIIVGSLGEAISVSQPGFVGDSVCFLWDKSGFVELYCYHEGRITCLSKPNPTRDLGNLDWQMGLSHWTALDEENLIAVTGPKELTVFSAHTGKQVRSISTPFEVMSSIQRVSTSEVALIAPLKPSVLVRLRLLEDEKEAQIEILKRSSEVAVDEGYVSEPRNIVFETSLPGGEKAIAHAIYFPPHNKDYTGYSESKPPAIVEIHGGPTGAAKVAFSLPVNYFTSRGFAFVMLDYGGSSSYGKAYRDRLIGQWGVVDLNDSIACVHYLVQEGLAEQGKTAITGGSAGGYTVLQSLCQSDAFSVGASLYGVADLKGLATDTHKFESQYLFGLLGGTPEQVPDNYRDRSPLYHANNIRSPLLILQGRDDRVVPIAQADAIVEAVKGNGVHCEYIVFEGEGHGFRRTDSLKKTYQAQLDFYCDAFGIKRRD